MTPIAIAAIFLEVNFSFPETAAKIAVKKVACKLGPW
jgi:hypothetical protein